MGLSPQELLLLVQGPTPGGNADSGSPEGLWLGANDQSARGAARVCACVCKVTEHTHTHTHTYTEERGSDQQAPVMSTHTQYGLWSTWLPPGAHQLTAAAHSGCCGCYQIRDTLAHPDFSARSLIYYLTCSSQQFHGDHFPNSQDEQL